jgi:signal transduction histidine kinase
VIDPQQLSSAVGNVVDNALRHGAGRPVEVRLDGRAGGIAVTVRDQGPGISEQNRARIFDRFFTTERDRGGTGLGLAITRAVAEARGGSVTFRTGPSGTTFRIEV